MNAMSSTQSGVFNKTHGKKTVMLCVICGNVITAKWRMKYCSSECILKNSVAPDRCYIEIAVL